MATVRPWRSLLLMLLLIAAVGAASRASAQAAPSEYDLKAAFIYQFLAYVTWPAGKSPDGAALIGVVGAPELVANLATLSRNQAADARAIEVISLLPGADTSGLHVLFVAANSDPAADALLQAAVTGGVLTVTEELPRRPASVINFEIIDNKVRFDVALGLARANGLEISGRLLQVALRVLEP